MHKGDQVFVLPGRKTYHLTDDDCPVTASILKRKKKAKVVSEASAKAQGLKLCTHCKKEYQEDLAERPFKFFKSLFKLFS